MSAATPPPSHNPIPLPVPTSGAPPLPVPVPASVPAPVPGGPVPAPPPDAPHHHGKTAAELAAAEVQDNALYRGLKSFWARLKAGQLVPSKVLAVVVVVAVGVGLWWWFSGQSKKTDSRRWAGLHNLTASDRLNSFAADNPDTTAALVARRDRALNLLGADGTAKLDNKSPAEWKKAVESIEAARDELTTLAELFKKDRGMKAACLRDAAVAERALIGVPKKGPPNEDAANQRGTAAKAAELYRQAAAAIGANTVSGEKFTKEAKTLDENAATILSTNSYLYARVVPEGIPDGAAPLPPVNPTPGANPDSKTPSTSRTPSTGK